MKFFAALILFFAIVGLVTSSATTTEVESFTTTSTSAPAGTAPCGPQGPCGLLKCLGGASGCGQKVYIFNK